MHLNIINTFIKSILKIKIEIFIQITYLLSNKIIKYTLICFDQKIPNKNNCGCKIVYI